jgi:molybdopterin synthase sulfur carrier subunit
MSKPLTILYFAWLRERVGFPREELPLPDGVATVGDLIGYLSGRSVAHAEAFRTDRKVRCSVNQEFVDRSAPIAPGDEIGFFPPVTGG